MSRNTASFCSSEIRGSQNTARPDKTIGGAGVSYSFSDLVDITAFTSLLESINRATGISNGLVGPGGELLTQAGWCDACVHYHRAVPETARLCQESNLELLQRLRDGEVVGALCKNGLYDYATPVTIEGHHLATLFLGQVFHTPPDMAGFGERAEQFGYDKDAYLKSIRAVPVVSKAQIDAYIATIIGMADILAEIGLSRVREARLERDLDRSTEQRIQVEDLLEFSPVGISWTDADGNIEYVNRQFVEMFGYSRDEVRDLTSWVGKAYPDDKYRESTVDPWWRRAEEAHEHGVQPPELESNICCKDGSERRVITRVSWVGNRRLASYTDISAHWQSEQRSRAYNAMLEMVANAAPLPEILEAIVRTIEADAPTSFCSLLLLDSEGKRLLTGAAPSLPVFFNEAVDGLEIGDGVGSCGTAAYRGERVVVEDISSHEYWRPAADLASQAGLAACWSEPILGSDGKVLGTFASYHSQPTLPTLDDLERIAYAANLAAIAIENQRTRDALLRSEREFRTLAENAPVNIARYDHKGRLSYANSRLAASMPVPIGTLIGRRLDENPALPFAGAFQKIIDGTIETGEELMFEAPVPAPEGGDKETHLINMMAERDDTGAITGALSIGRDITENKRLQQELERQAHYDYLTSLTNRRYFVELAGKELARFGRYGGKLSLIMFDLDFFKRINDKYGHNIGDMVLSQVAQVSRGLLRDVDVVGRIGGEEFVALLPNIGGQEAAKIAERLRLSIAASGLQLPDGEQLHFTASFGVASIDSNTLKQGKTPTVDDLLLWADDAMYQAKEGGRNRVCLSDGQ